MYFAMEDTTNCSGYDFERIAIRDKIKDYPDDELEIIVACETIRRL